MRKSLFNKLSKSFFAFSIGLICIMGFTCDYLFQSEFNKYLMEVNTSQIEELSAEIQELYDDGSGFSREDFRQINRSSNRSGYITQVISLNRETLIDTRNSGYMEVENSEAKNLDGYTAHEFKLTEAGGTGKIIISHKDASDLSAEDKVFQTTIKKALILGGFVLMLFSISISYIISKWLSRPILNLKLVAERIGEGELEHRYSGRSSDPVEIHELADSINSMAETVQKQEELRKQLVSDIAHEIRTPIAVVRSHLEAMIEGVWDATPEKLESIYEEVDMINGLVERLKDIHTLEAGSQILNLEYVDLDSELKGLVNSIIPMYGQKQMSLELESEADLEMKLDRGKFKQIIYNLLLNAYKYSNADSAVRIKAYRAKNTIEISVLDNGTGISREDLPMIFERFYRGDKSRTKSCGGAGLGLTIVAALVKVHGWDIVVKSELGKGSEFIIKIPMEVRNS